MAMTKLTRLKPEPQGIYDASKSYGVNSLVTSADGVRVYLSVKDVPAGTPLTNGDYYVIHTDLTQTKTSADNAAAKALAARNEMIEIARGLTDPVTASGNPVSKELAGGIPFDSVQTVLTPKQAGSGDPSPSNIRSISGWTGAKITRCGKNLLRNTGVSNTANGITFTVNSDGSIVCSGTSTATQAFPISTKMLPYGSYILTGCPTGGSESTYKLQTDIVKSDGSIKYISDFGSGVRFTVDDTSESMTVFIVVNKGGTHNNLTFRPMIRFASDTDAAYVPYQGNDSYSIEFGRTVYSGVFDWQTGVLAVDWGIVTMDGTNQKASAMSTGSNYIQVRLGDMRPDAVKVNGDGNLICSHLPEKFGQYSEHSYPHLFLDATGDTPYIRAYFSIEIASTVDELNAYFAAQHNAGTPVQVVYKLATPQTIQLTAEEIKQLNGANTLYGDGTITINGRQRPGQNG